MVTGQKCPVLEWWATYNNSSGDDEYNRIHDNSSGGSEFNSDTENFDEDEDASCMFNELQCLRKDGLDREAEEEEGDEKEEQAIVDEDVIKTGESERHS